MATIAKVIRKAEKKAKRQAEKRNRAQLVSEHNLTFDHQKVVEAQKAIPFKIMQAESWGSPFKGQASVEAPTLKQMFFLQEGESTEPQQGV